MKFWSILLLKILLGWLVIQIFLILIFIFYVSLNKGKSISDRQLPKTAVILCLRGADPFLPNCLQALLQQDYPQYDLKIVVDSQEDPAWKIAHDTVGGATNVQIEALKIASTACSLKCSSLVQAVSELDASYKVVALVDADAVVHSTWLRELVTPLMDRKVGATTGNRWYLSKGRYWGTLVRYLWNVSAVIQMYLYGICWGGSLAIKTQVIHQTGILDKWARAYCEDTMIQSLLAKHGLKVKFVPSLLILNQEECTLSGLMNWMKRQFLAAKLYHPKWWFVVSDSVFSILFPNLILALILLNFIFGEWQIAGILFTCYNIYLFGLVLIISILETSVRRVINNSGSITKISPGLLIKTFIGLPFTHWYCGFALVSSLRISKVSWRNIIYLIKSPFNIVLTEYRPYQSNNQPIDKEISL